MWIVITFDLPMQNGLEARIYRYYRKELLKSGFFMLQKSVYYRFESSDDVAKTTRNRLLSIAPENGSVIGFLIPNQTMQRANGIFDGKCVSLPGTEEEYAII